MIGATSGAMAGPASGAAPAPVRAMTGNGTHAAAVDADVASSRANASAAADPASTKAADASAGAENLPVNAAVKRDAAQDGQDREGAPPLDFAALLANAGTVEATTPVIAAASAEPIAADPAATAGLPDQLLALLSGSWAMPAPPAGEPAPAGNAPAQSALPTPAAGNPVGGEPLGAATPVPDSAASAAIGATSEALAQPADTALGAPSERGSDLGINIPDAAPSFDHLILSAASPTAALARPSALAPTAPLALPADPDAGFDDGFGARIAWMAEQRVGHAEIRLNPEHVGPIDVHVQLDGTRVSAEFHSAHAEVRQAIEASLPRLREMLGQHGLQLGQADVGQRQSRHGQSARSAGDDRGSGTTPDDGRMQTTTAVRLRSRGLLDEYA